MKSRGLVSNDPLRISEINDAFLEDLKCNFVERPWEIEEETNTNSKNDEDPLAVSANSILSKAWRYVRSTQSFPAV
jgi:hypothetical protein